MLKYFDYIFYRIYSYYTLINDDISILHTLGFLWITQVLFFGILFSLTDKFMNGTLTTSGDQKSRSRWIFVIAFSIMLIFDLLRYLRNRYYLKLMDVYKDNRFNKSIKAWMIFVHPILLFALTIPFLVLTK